MRSALRTAPRPARGLVGLTLLALCMGLVLAGCGSLFGGAWPVRVEARLVAPGVLGPLASHHVVEVEVFVEVGEDTFEPVAFGASGRPQAEGGETVLLFTVEEPTRTVWLPDGVYDVYAVAKDGDDVTHTAEDLGVVIGPRSVNGNLVVLELLPVSE